MCVVKTWRPVPGFGDRYQVSSHGDVYSNYSRRCLRPHVGNNGYHEITLRKEGQSFLFRVHSLVALAFLGPCPAGQLVRHGDDIGVHNCLMNLSYGTPKDNAADMLRNGNHWRQDQTHCVNGHEFTDQNTYLRPNGGRDCRTCLRARRRKSNQKRRERALEAAASVNIGRH